MTDTPTPEAVAAILKDVTWVRNNIEALASDRDAHEARADAAEARVARLVEALREIKTCTTEYGGAAKALRIINAALRGEGRG